MNCSEFQTLMADALGDELSSHDRPAFDDHLAACAGCRSSCASLARVITSMRGLPGPKRVVLRRDANRLILEEADAPPRTSRPVRLAAIVRYAASVLIAFTAGYALHAGVTLTAGTPPAEVTAVPGATAPQAATLQSSLARTVARNAGKSDLAQCLIAMSHRRN